MIVRPTQSRHTLGIVLIIFAVFLIAGIDTSAKWLMVHGMPPPQAMVVRFMMHVVVMAVIFAPVMPQQLVRVHYPIPVLLRALALLASTVFNFYGIKYLSLTMHSAIMFTAPMWVCVLSIPLLGERIGLQRWAALCAGFIGVLIITRPWQADAHWAVIFSILAAASLAIYMILTRSLAGKDTATAQQFYAGLIPLIVLSPFALGGWIWPTTLIDWVAFVMVGVFGWSSHQVISIASRFAPASTLAPFMYLQIVFMVLSSWLIFHQPPNPWVLIGAFIVLVGGLWIWWCEVIHKMSHPAHKTP
ncbi:MAG: DMT family transporter [Pseudomonadota bacterium]